MEAKVSTTTVKQEANKLLGTEAKELCYIIIETKKGKHVINVGKKTLEAVNALEETKK